MTEPTERLYLEHQKRINGAKTEDVKTENVKAMVDFTKEYGAY